ncbi:ATP-grasp domain-containing protein [uncultured Microscilla sp.]|uniref:ATP-grasp domain-containing protein n=1 Tax=uncultured Microscilla sp. TaxID=432653 RepID=UPI0026105CDB|nr:ATP-grasp domain-containing protein [uncultured Microscilla sp.]
MKKIRWIVQKNNYATADRDKIIAACQQLQLPYELVQVIPFATTLPVFSIDKHHENIYYGSTTMMERVYNDLGQPAGLFYDETTFTMGNYINQWKASMLSSEGEVFTFEQFRGRDYPSDARFFIRPNADSKAFAGMVLTFAEIKSWYDKVVQNKAETVDATTEIFVSTAYHIEKEWRNIVVNGKVVTSTAYRKSFELYKSATDVPPEMIRFVEERCREYQPHDIFAMDVAKCSGEYEYYIIECGCANSIGFYHCDIFAYVKHISEFLSVKINNKH